MALYLKNEDWRAIAEQVSNEMDPAKLTILAAQLCRVLDGEREDTSRRRKHQANQTKSLRDAA